MRAISVNNPNAYAEIIIVVEGREKEKCFKTLVNKLKKYYKFRLDYHEGNTFMLIWSDGTIDYDVNHLVGCCMANFKQRPLSIERFLKNFNELIVKKNKKLVTKLYKEEFDKFYYNSRRSFHSRIKLEHNSSSF